MKTGRNILIGAILSLSAGSAIAPVVAVAVAAPAVTAVAGAPNTWYHQ